MRILVSLIIIVLYAGNVTVTVCTSKDSRERCFAPPQARACHGWLAVRFTRGPHPTQQPARNAAGAGARDNAAEFVREFAHGRKLQFARAAVILSNFFKDRC